MLDLFADDATLSSSDPPIFNLTDCLNEDLKNFQDWCIRNNMVVNVPKTSGCQHRQYSIMDMMMMMMMDCTDLKYN